ncbi:MAG: hypothetical protein WBW81_02320 [Methylocella sp.]
MSKSRGVSFSGDPLVTVRPDAFKRFEQDEEKMGSRFSYPL